MHKRIATAQVCGETAVIRFRLRVRGARDFWSRPAAQFRYGPSKKSLANRGDDGCLPPAAHHFLSVQRAAKRWCARTFSRAMDESPRSCPDALIAWQAPAPSTFWPVCGDLGQADREDGRQCCRSTAQRCRFCRRANGWRAVWRVEYQLLAEIVRAPASVPLQGTFAIAATPK